jgi:SAM-dependent methyltransferase
MPIDRPAAEAASWWQRQRRRRARRALELQLEYQRRKARSLIAEGVDITPHMQRHSAEVRALVESARPIRDGDRVLEVGSGAHGAIFYFGAARGVGIDPLAHHYVSLFPAWQRRVGTVSALGEALPFGDAAFDVVLSDNVVDHAERPAAILGEIARVLAPAGVIYFEVNVSHPVYGWLSALQGGWRALGIPFGFADFSEHTVHLSRAGARRLFDGQPLQIVWERDTVAEARSDHSPGRRPGLRQWIKRVWYFHARYEAVAIRQPENGVTPRTAA